MEPKIIKFKPYVGGSEEDAKGKLTKVTIKEDVLEYDVCYELVVKISMLNNMDEEITKNSIRYIEEVGVKTKESITNLVKYSKTEYDDEGNPFKVFSLDVCNPAVTLTFDIEKEEDRDKLYEELYNWKFANGN